MKTFIVIAPYYGQTDVYIRTGKSRNQVRREEDTNYATSGPLVMELGKFQTKFAKALQDFTTRRHK